MHPYKTYKIIPEAYPCSGVDPKFLSMSEEELDEWVKKVYDDYIKRVNERNKKDKTKS